ncbi:MAG TPA: hypothetical protein PK857_06950 [Hyphomicrobium sp.]|nr:hypothetical protein [Hyphomicrobium sp.]HRO50410.1 hypothetical protein [Hyphomicrobium sp.]
MSLAGLPAPAVVYLLADHLDAALAAGEDLLKSTLSWNGGDARASDLLASSRRAEREAVDAVRKLELLLLTRVLKSRESARDLAKAESFFKSIAGLYTSGTAIVADAAQEMADETAYAFDAGDGVTAYLRSRGLIAAEEAAPLEAALLPVTEDLLIAGRMPLGTLLDLIATFLDTLETHYELYDPPERKAAIPIRSQPTGALV